MKIKFCFLSVQHNFGESSFLHVRSQIFLKTSNIYEKNPFTPLLLQLAFISAEFIYLAVCLTRGPKPLSKRALHIVRSRASSFRCEYPLLSLRSSSSFLRLLPRLPVTSIPPLIFPSITCRRRQFLRKM
jgi:hypothetical protein